MITNSLKLSDLSPWKWGQKNIWIGNGPNISKYDENYSRRSRLHTNSPAPEIWRKVHKAHYDYTKSRSNSADKCSLQ